MFGTLLNASAIVLGGLVGLGAARQLSPATQRNLKVLLGAFTVYVGLGMTLKGLHGPFWNWMKEFALVILALILGRFTGHALRIQHNLNRLGRYAKGRFEWAQTTVHPAFGEGFVSCTLLFCVGPMAVLGPLQEGLNGDFKILAIKSVMDGLATLAFVQSFGWGAILAALPVLAYQGTLTLGARILAPWLEQQALLDPLYATGGLILFSVALVILGIKRVELGDYLPSLLYAPLLSLALA